jgi:hypothetical protein
MDIHRFRDSDWSALWPVLRTTFEAGDTYTFSPHSTEAEIRGIHNRRCQMPCR